MKFNGQIIRQIREAFLGSAVVFLVLSVFASAAFPKSTTDKRSKVIDFEDEVVEGLNRRPLDSLSQVSEKDRRHRKPHLYRKRAGFRSENAETLHALRYTP